LLVLVAGMGLLSMVHRDAQVIAENLVRHFHLNPAHGYPQIFIRTAADLNDARLWWLSAAALIYSTVRFVEAYGLWHERAWAEWFAILSAGMYLPVEIYEFWDKPNLVRGSVFIVNLGIVIYLAWLLAVNHRKKVAAEAACARAASAD
ncbi:MAG TPA: DUF2127 domain-containing protein, partial [Verrucomicrobiae bacterium]|nr:DUF2127 domain-containing protein [Verrucomicrobiae bacterium]